MRTNFRKWPMESASTTLRTAPQRDGLCRDTVDTLGLVEDSLGMLLETSRVTLPASSLPLEEYEARITAHQKRIARELSRMAAVERSQRPAVRRTTAPPAWMKYGDLKIVSCARCSRTLLGESQEPLRAAALSRGLKRAANFPPPVAARLNGGRPYCDACAAVCDPPPR